MKKNIEVKYFAILREQAGITVENIETLVKTPAQLFTELAQAHEFSLRYDQIKVSVNEAFESMDYALESGDQVVFIPPVAGG